MTLLFRSSSFMLIFLLPACTQAAVKDVFDQLYEGLGPVVFRRTFRIILTDNGPEFKDPWSIERAPNGERRTRVFYCDPYHSNQKGRLEKNHEFIRYILPKGTNFSFLTRKKVTAMMNHINSTKRLGIGNRSPYELVDPADAHMQLLMQELKMDIIPPDDVRLMPDLIK